MIIVQRGNPSIYRAISPKETIANLKQKLTESFNKKIREAEVLAEQLMPIYEGAEKPEELELAYIIRGQRNIMNRMKALIEAARKEVTVFISHPLMLEELRPSLIEAKGRRVKINIGVTRDVLKSWDPSELGEVKLLRCPCSMLISDMKTLLSVSSWTREVAVLTQDQNLIRVCGDYYDNPQCCTKIN